MPRIEFVNPLLAKTMQVAANVEEITQFATNWLFSQIQEEKTRQSVLVRAKILETNLKTPPLNSELAQDPEYLLHWAQIVTKKTKYIKRVAASEKLLHLDISRTGKSAASFWPFPGINDRSRELLRCLHPIDFLSPADDPRQRPISVDRIKGIATRIFKQREIEPELYLGYLGPIDWLWQYLAVLTPFQHEVVDEFGTLRLSLAPPKTCIFSGIQYMEQTVPIKDDWEKVVDIQYELEVLKDWKITGPEFLELFKLRDTELVDIFLRKQGFSKLGTIFKTRVFDHVSSKFDIPTEQSDLREALLTAKQTLETQKLIVKTARKWSNPPSISKIKLQITTQDVDKLAGGMEQALPSDPVEAVKLAGQWLKFSQSSNQELQLAIHAMVLAWSCGNPAEATEVHRSKRQVIIDYCSKYNLSDPSKLGWTDMDKWLAVAKECCITSKYFERCKAGKKIIKHWNIEVDNSITDNAYLTPEVVITTLHSYYPQRCYLHLSSELKNILISDPYLFKTPLSPIEIFMGGKVNPCSLVCTVAHNTTYKGFPIEEENNIYQLIGPANPQEYLKENINRILIDTQFNLGRYNTRTPNCCMMELCKLIADNYLPERWEEDSRLIKIPFLSNPSPFLRELHRLWLSTLERIKQEKKELGKKLLNKPEQLNVLTRRINPLSNDHTTAVAELFRLDQKTTTLEEEIDIRLSRKEWINLTIRTLK